uniref:Uncharacterized protein n=1 Tax=Adineta vaga TaxID=104782 RepID=B3G4F9_ADIVA|nr:unknown [Adineta vaga]
MGLITPVVLIFTLEICLLGFISASSDYSCYENNITVKFELSTANHSASNPASSCSLQQCNVTSIDNQTCSLLPTPCFNYLTINNTSYCAPAIQCSLLEVCDNVTYSCVSNNSICIINSCCSLSAVCLPLLATNYCKRGENQHLLMMLDIGKMYTPLASASFNSTISLVEKN